MLEDGSLQVDLPFAIPLREQVVDELIVRSPLAPVVIVRIVEHVFDVIRQAFTVPDKQVADMLLLPPVFCRQVAKLLNSVFLFIWVGHFQSAMIVDGAKLLMKTILPKDNVPAHT